MINSPMVRQMIRIWKARARVSQRDWEEKRVGEFIIKTDITAGSEAVSCCEEIASG